MAEDRMLNDEILLGLIKANAGGGGGGTPNYNQLENKPQIAGTELQGNKSLADLGIASAQSVSNITNGESINDFAGVETALNDKQGTLTAGDYIDITNGEISVNREIPANNFTYELVTKSIGNDDASMTVKKYANGSLVSSTDYLYTNVTTAVNIDGYFTLQYSNGWKYTLLQASTDHASGYVATWGYQTVVDYTEVFPTEDTSGRKLIIKSELDAALESKQDALTFDDTPTDGSNNPVKSNGIYDSEKDIYATMGKVGAKNLIPYPYYQTTQTVAGITTTDNGDGTLTFNGTCTTNGVIFRLASNDATIEIPLGKDRYILTWVESSEHNKYFRIDIGLKKSDNTTDVKNGKFGIIEIDNTNNQYKGIFAVSVYSSSGLTVSNCTFKPMLRLASDTDNTYQPYAKTNKQLTDDVALLDSGKADTDMVAADFNAVTSYTAGNYCVQDGKLYKFKANHSGAWSSADVDEVKITGELSALKSGLIDQTAGNTFRIDTAKMPLYYDGASYSGYVPFPFVTKNTNYTVTLLDVAQNNVGTVTENATVGVKKTLGFSFNITGTYDSTKCGASIICDITFA